MSGVVLTDIEGTTTPVRFVHDVLFPYARARLPGWLPAHAGEPDVAAAIDAVRADAGVRDLADVVVTLLAWIDADEKRTPLKALQGRIWEAGYRDGSLRSPVYPDVPVALRAWRAEGRRLAVYSSGSVHAQRLLFAHTDAGDLTPLFSAYFDTTTGPKRAEASYRAIAAALGVPAADVRFLSDVVEELDAAAAAGMRTTLVDRDGGARPRGAHPIVGAFSEIR